VGHDFLPLKVFCCGMDRNAAGRLSAPSGGMARFLGRAISSTVNRLPAATARVQSPIGPYGIYGWQSDTAAYLFPSNGLPLPIIISPMLHREPG
jgi:hypothetical protein